MNERIKELYKQASKQDYFPCDSEEVYMSPKDLEKFAELIVRECAGIAYEYDIPNLTGRLPGEFIGNRMKRLLGVE